MASPILTERDEEPMALSPLTMRVTQELPMVSVELGEALLLEQANLRREVLLWQRWVRYLALGAMVLLSLLYSSTMQDAVTPLALLAGGSIDGVGSRSLAVARRPKLDSVAAADGRHRRARRVRVPHQHAAAVPSHLVAGLLVDAARRVLLRPRARHARRAADDRRVLALCARRSRLRARPAPGERRRRVQRDAV